MMAAPAAYKILVVEDEQDLLRGLEINLTREGYRVLKAASGDAGLRLAIKENPHLVVLDVMLPGMNGLDVCRELRQKGFSAPIIMLTAKSEEIDRVVGLEIGADDYVTKPFSVRELLARIRVQLRRQPPRAPEGLAHYRFAEVEIDFQKCCASRKGKPLELTAKEFDLLRLLIRSRGEVVTRDRMLNEVWGYEACPTTRTVDNHILRLRQKLENDPARPEHILSIYGEGYKFVD
jgi:two-component system alkaline phosphatase synthesis response regulator PhoP